MAKKKEKKGKLSSDSAVIEILHKLEESKKDHKLQSMLDKIDNQIELYKSRL
tara:strand:+ start:313 stop:468 length:156 start_codon:yes stop_codon:yes gene_type:complete